MSAVNGPNNVTPMMDVSGLDIESMMMAVQSNRANLLEAQLMGEMKNVQAKNLEMASLNGRLSIMTGASQLGYASTDAKPDTALSATQQTNLSQLAPQVPAWEVTLQDGTKCMVNEAGKNEAQYCKDVYWAFRSNNYSGSKAVVSIADKGVQPDPTYDLKISNKGELDKAVTALKSQVDSMGSTQQMDMLRLQSLSNKRNEAFDLMTNFMKKFADKRESIVGNMR